jgi:hypothetical protein
MSLQHSMYTNAVSYQYSSSATLMLSSLHSLNWCDKMSVQHSMYTNAVSCQYSSSATLMQSSLHSLHWCDKMSVQHSMYFNAVSCQCQHIFYSHAIINQYNIYMRSWRQPFAACRFTKKKTVVLNHPISTEAPFLFPVFSHITFTSVFTIPFLLFIPFCFPSVLSAFVYFILVLYFFFSYTLLLYSIFIQFPQLNLLVQSVAGLTCTQRFFYRRTAYRTAGNIVPS